MGGATQRRLANGRHSTLIGRGSHQWRHGFDIVGGSWVQSIQRAASASGVLAVTTGSASSLHSFVVVFFFFFSIHGGSEA